MSNRFEWQQRAMEIVSDEVAAGNPNFLCAVTPGGGKTRFALQVAKWQMQRGMNRFAVVTPSTRLREQWVDVAATMDLDLDRVGDSIGQPRRDFDGGVFTYQGLRTQSQMLRRYVAGGRTMVVLDEIHHAAADLAESPQQWGADLRYAFDPAVYRLLLSGTPRRTDRSPIPWVTYDDAGFVQPNFSFSYGDAIFAGTCRKVAFHAYDGELGWRYGDDEFEGSFKEQSAGPASSGWWRAALSTHHAHNSFVTGMLRGAEEQLRVKQKQVADAGGLVVCRNQRHASEVFGLMREMGMSVLKATSDDGAEANNVIKRFNESPSVDWLVTVKMVSEGVDIPRLRVGVFLTNTVTDLFFRQWVGRFVRRRDQDADNDWSRLYIPAHADLLELAEQIETEINTAIDLMPEERRKRERDTDDQPVADEFAVLHSSSYPDGIYQGAEFFPQDEYDSTAAVQAVIPQLKDVNTEDLIRFRHALQHPPVTNAPVASPVISKADRVDDLCGDINKLVKRYAYNLEKEFQDVHAQLNAAIGIRSQKNATEDQLEWKFNLIKQRCREQGLSIDVD